MPYLARTMRRDASVRRARSARSLPAALVLAGVATLLAVLPCELAAQSLRGSRLSVARMYHRATSRDLYFYRTSTGVRRAQERGRFVPLRSGRNYAVATSGDVAAVLPETRTFVERLGAQYRAGCGGRLVVTGATRPLERKLRNSSTRSVHPTGMAIDLRKPSGRCLTWLRKTLVSLERSGVIEATEERRPPHFHIAVFPEAYTRPVARLPSREAAAGD
jgi:hypothetical protein